VANAARVAALRMLAMRRLTEVQLWNRLAARGYAAEAIVEAIASCKRDGYIDDALFAALYVEGPREAVGDVRLVAELVKRGIDREAAQRAVLAAPRNQTERIALAYERLARTKRELSYQSAARALERLGFPTSLIYRVLREHAAAAFGISVEVDSALH
jgi:SOS response regulatory protein OraA/RecX